MTETLPVMQREAAALALVKSYVPWAVGAAAIPFPGVDFATLLAVQQRMLCKLADHYGLTYRKEAAKSVVAALLGDVLGSTLSGGLVSLAKLAPGIGTLVGIVSLPAFAGAVTYALGRVFISHFEAGGTFLDLQPEALRAHFREEFDKAGRESGGKAAA
ncbi:MAG: DUF697 domain-containing protein [Sulfuricellaceae bacterium]